MTRPPPEPDFEATPIGRMVRLTAQDGHTLDAYIVEPAGRPRGGLVIGQEMYGLTRYLTGVCDLYASQGYLTIAPALYDRQARGIVLEYTRTDHDRAQRMYTGWNWDLALLDVNAARVAVSQAGKVGVLGYCWGGSLAWLAACRLSFSCAIAYYGSAMPDYADETARCPVLANCGDEDASMPIARIREFAARQPGVSMNIFAGAKHAFDNPLRGEGRYHPEACARSRIASLDFLANHVG